MIDINRMSTHEIANYLRDERNTAFILWQVDDVIAYAEFHHEKMLTDDEAASILRTVNRSKDCEAGITWHTICDAIDDFLKNSKNG